MAGDEDQSKIRYVYLDRPCGCGWKDAEIAKLQNEIRQLQQKLNRANWSRR